MRPVSLLLALALALGCSESRLPLEGEPLPPPDGPITEPPPGVPAIYLARADGSGARLVVTGERPAWSPTGRRVAFQRDGQVWVSDGVMETALGPGIEPAWAPDGRRIAFTGAEGIAVMADDGAGATTILGHDFRTDTWAEGDQGVGKPAWSLDGKRIAFEHRGDGDLIPAQIFVMGADGSDPHRLTPPSGIQYAESDPAWSADGREIVFWSFGYGIASVGADGGLPHSLVHDFPAVAYGAKPAPAPAGGAILFTANRFAAEGPALWVLEEEGAEPRVVLENAVDGVWSPDGRRILFGRTVTEVAPDLPVSAGTPPPSPSNRPAGQALSLGRSVVRATAAGTGLMSESYRQCPECGKRALRIASRCPGCFRDLPHLDPPEAGPGLALDRFLSPKVAGGLLAALTVGLAMIGRTSRPSTAQSPALADNGPASIEVAYALPPPRPPTPPADAPRLLVARTWTSVREARNKGAMVEAVLLPGDTVVADSLARGWYRVMVEDEVLGYAHRSTLVSPPASDSLQ